MIVNMRLKWTDTALVNSVQFFRPQGIEWFYCPEHNEILKNLAETGTSPLYFDIMIDELFPPAKVDALPFKSLTNIAYAEVYQQKFQNHGGEFFNIV